MKNNLNKSKEFDNHDNLIDVPMPKMGESVMEGTIIKWHKKVGDMVKKDEIIFEMSTDKVDTEVPSPADGIIADILYNENDTVEVGKVVAKISTTGKIERNAKPAPQKEIIEEKQIIKEEKVITKSENNLQLNKNIKTSNRFYSPLVLNIAKKENVSFEELENISGTGLNNRVTKNDILRFIKNRGEDKILTSSKAEEENAYIKSAYTKGNDVEIIAMNKTRKLIMEHMIKSRDTSVHVTEMMEVDMTWIYNYIKQNREKFKSEENVKLTYMPFISMAVIKALKEYPWVNASIEGDKIIVKKYVNLGIAVAVEPNGLIVPNIKHADEKNLLGLTKAINEIGYKARNKKLLPDDVADGTFSITNYGVFGALFGNPIINQPEVGILGVGAVIKRPVVIELNGNDVIAIKPMMYLSLSHDHRLVDGMLGGKFLKFVKSTLENFDKLNF